MEPNREENAVLGVLAVVVFIYLIWVIYLVGKFLEGIV